MALAAAAATPAGGAEGDAPRDQEVMRPTELGLRMTPRVARGLARNWVCELAGMKMFGSGEDEKKIDLTDEQRSRMADAAARRLMQMAHENGKAGQQFLEGLFESMLLSGDDKIRREHATEFAKRAQPMVPLAREFMKGFSEDCRPMLRPAFTTPISPAAAAF